MLKSVRLAISKIDIHTLEVIKKSTSSSLVKAGGMVIGLGVSVFLGRTLGAEGLGIINLSNQIVAVVLVFCLLGIRQVIVKEVAIGYHQKDWLRIGNTMFSAYLINGCISIIISIALIIVAPWISESIFNEPRLTTPLIIASLAITPQVFSRIFSSGLIGYRKIWQSNLVDRTLSIAVVGIILFAFWILNYEIDIIKVAIFYGIARFAVTISMWIYWKKLYHNKQKKKFIGRNLMNTALPLLLITSTTVIAANSSTIMLGWLGNTKEVGLYSVAARLALLTSFFLQVSNAALSPKIAALFASDKKKEMGIMVKKVTRGLAIVGVLPIFIFILFGNPILSLWGGEFVGAYWILIILSIGQFFNISTGASGVMLIMCGKERILGRIKILEVLSNIILNYILIINLQAIGAAIATAITITILNILKVYIVKKEMGINIIKLV